MGGKKPREREREKEGIALLSFSALFLVFTAILSSPLMLVKSGTGWLVVARGGVRPSLPPQPPASLRYDTRRAVFCSQRRRRRRSATSLSITRRTTSLAGPEREAPASLHALA
jgi:hypothetical protein